MSRLLALARPKGMILISTLPLVGFGYGLWEQGSTVHPFVVLPTMLALFGSWALGHAGAMWLNAELDQDQGEVLLGRPVTVPRGTGIAGYLALIASVSVSVGIGWPIAICAGICAVLAILYSHPRVALKPTAVGGPLVNGVGYGSLSPIAGWLATDPVLTWRAVVTVVLAVFFILGVYFAAQAFQADEDRARGYRTLVATHGPRATLQVARFCLSFAVVGAHVLAIAGAYPRAALVGIPVWIWMDRHFAAWLRKKDGGTGADASKLVGILCLAVFLMLLGAYAHQAYVLHYGLPAAGCGTALVPEALAPICGGQIGQ
ncbi:MAG: UbiA family prenyltransferase [Sandaracinaceae bacterium]|nr:UbiA family prenyltransferase [Sandaracinaceae bacterium]